MKVLDLLRGLAGVLLAAGAAHAQQPSLRLELNVPEQRLHLLEAGEVIRSYDVSVGMPGNDTPDGSFRITHAEWNPSWKPPASEWAKDRTYMPPGPNNPMGRVKLFFTPLYFIHGTPEEEKIGTPASRGCVRMRNRDVVELARILHARHAPGVTPAAIDRILASPTTTRAVPFRTPVPVEIRYELLRISDGQIHLYPNLYGRPGVHPETVRQALLAAGYPLDLVKPAEIRALVELAAGVKEPTRVAVEKAFPWARGRAPQVRPVRTPRGRLGN